MIDIASMDLGGKVPRSYQVRAVEMCRDEIRQGRKRIILCKPTGAGKTLTSCMLMKLAMLKKSKVVFIANRRELIKQASDAIADCGVFHGMILAKQDGRYEPTAPVQVASKQTLSSRALKRDMMQLPPCDLLILDECHGSVAKDSMTLIRAIRLANPKMITIGLTATPARGDDKGLGGLFESIVQPVTYQELRNSGHLVRAAVKALFCPNMTGVTQAKWDKYAAAKVDRPQLVGDIYENWKRYASDRTTVGFGKTIEHSKHLRDLFAKKGVKVEHIDESTDVSERADILTALGAGDIQVLFNVGICCEGWDEPRCKAVILACPTRSLVKYRQTSGRALRPFDNFTDCCVLDHAGAVFTHGTFPDEDIDWPLKTAGSAAQDLKAQRQKGERAEPTLCNGCHSMFYGKMCPTCGSKNVTNGREIAVRHGMLKELRREDFSTNREAPFSLKERQWKDCLFVMGYKGQTFGAAARMYKAKIGEMPWETQGLPDIPKHDEWKARVTDLFPWYGKRTKSNTGV